MKETRNLARIVTHRRQIAPPLLDFDAGEKIKENRLVNALLGSTVPTRANLIRMLYDQATDKNDTAFRQLHSRVQGKLLNHLYFLDHTDPRYSVSRRYQLECLDLLHKGTILNLEGDQNLSIKLFSDCHSLAVQDGFTLYAIDAAQQLRGIYADTQQNKQFRAITKELARLHALRRLEEEAEALYAEGRLARTGTVASRKSILTSLIPKLKRLQELNELANSPITAELYYKLKMMYLEQSGDYLGIIDFTTESERQLEIGYYNPHRFDVRFNLFMKLCAYLLTQQPQKGLEVASIAEKLFHPTSLNWVYFEEHHFLLALHAGQYDLARRILTKCQVNPVFARQSSLAQQRWELFGAYLDFVLPPSKPVTFRRRPLGRLALVMPDYSRDKRGHNVAILIGQVLHYLLEQNTEAVVLRVESLRKYRLRHLRESTNQRIRTFLRLLQLVADEQFDHKRCAERAIPLLLELASTPPPGEAFADVEIIPYPILWGIILQQLRTLQPVMMTTTSKVLNL